MATIGKRLPVSLPPAAKDVQQANGPATVVQPASTPTTIAKTGFVDGAPPTTKQGATPTAFKDLAGVYPGGLQLGNAVTFSDWRPAFEALGKLRSNQLLEIGARMGPHYQSPPGTPHTTVALNLAETARARGQLDTLASVFSAVQAEVPGADLPAAPRTEFPRLTAAPTVRELATKLSLLDIDQLDFVAVKLGLQSLEMVSGSPDPKEAAFQLVTDAESRGHLPNLAEALTGAPDQLQQNAPLSAKPSPLEVAVALNALDPATLSAVAKAAGMSVEDVPARSHLGVAVNLARYAQSRGHLDALVTALATVKPS